MKRDIQIKGIDFHIGNYTPRRNEYEKGLKYKLYAGGIPTDHVFSTLREAKEFINNNYWLWL